MAKNKIKKVREVDHSEVVGEAHSKFLDSLYNLGQLARSTMSHSSTDFESKESVQEEVDFFKDELNKVLVKLIEVEEKAKLLS